MIRPHSPFHIWKGREALAQTPWGWKGASTGDGWGQSAEGTAEGASNRHDGHVGNGRFSIARDGVTVSRVMSFLERVGAWFGMVACPA